MTVRTQLTLVIAFHVIVSAVLSWALNIWADESCTLYATDGPFSFVCEKAVNFEWQPPAYHLVLSVWRWVHDGVFFARCFSILSTSLTILTICQATKNLGVKQPVLPAALFAFHPFGIYLATEIRPYGFATLIAALMLWTMLKAYWFVNETRSSWPNTLCIALGLYTNILLAIPLAAQTASILCFRRAVLSKFVLRTLFVLAVFAPMLWYLLNLAKNTELLPPDNTPANLAAYLLGSWQYIVFPLPRVDTTISVRIVLLMMQLGIVAFVVYRNRSKLAERHGFVASYVAVCYLALATFIYLTDLARTERYTYVLVPATIVSWAMLLELAESVRLRSIVYFISFLLCATSLVIVYQPMCKSGDWIRVAEYLRTTAEPGEPIVVFPSEVHTLLKYYYSRQEDIVPIPGPQRFDRFRMSDFRIPDRETLDRILVERLRNARSLMLVAFDPAIYRTESDDPLNFQLLEVFLAKDFHEVGRARFFDTTVRRYKRSGT